MPAGRGAVPQHKWRSVSSSGDLQQGVREYVTSSGDIVTVPEYVSTYGDLQEYEYVSSDSDLQETE